jgi:hypothetical protein
MKGQTGSDLITFTFIFIIMLVLIFLAISLITGNPFSQPLCSVQTWGKSDLYCAQDCSDMMNYCYNGPNSLEWKIHNRTAETLAAQKQQLQRQLVYEKEKQRLADDYGYTCAQLAYINDHLVDAVTQKDGGYIESSSSSYNSGIFSSSRSSHRLNVHLKQYVVTRVSATGMLLENWSYHTNCRDEKVDVIEDFYTEAEFVMYYVDNCVHTEDTK